MKRKFLCIKKAIVRNNKITCRQKQIKVRSLTLQNSLFMPESRRTTTLRYINNKVLIAVCTTQSRILIIEFLGVAKNEFAFTNVSYESKTIAIEAYLRRRLGHSNWVILCAQCAHDGNLDEVVIYQKRLLLGRSPTRARTITQIRC
jgi:hypothetical protein